MSKRRGPPGIILAILEIARHGKGKARIMGLCGLSFTQVNGYLDILSKAGWIEEVEGIWRTTEKGLEVCSVCLQCKMIFTKMRDESVS